MRVRPIRPNVSLPIVRCGVNDSDWKFIIGATGLGYMIPFLINTRVLHVPLEVWTTVLCFTAAFVAFQFTRRRKRPYWLQHRLRSFGQWARWRTHRRRRMLPLDPSTVTPQRKWIIPEEASIANS